MSPAAAAAQPRGALLLPPPPLPLLPRLPCGARPTRRCPRAPSAPRPLLGAARRETPPQPQPLPLLSHSPEPARSSSSLLRPRLPPAPAAQGRQRCPPRCRGERLPGSPHRRARTAAAARLSHDRGGVPGPAETLQHPVRPLLAPAAAGHHRHHSILLLLAPQAAEGQAPHQIVFSGRSRSRDAVMRTHHFRSEGFRSSPRHARRRVAPRLEETQPLLEAHHLSEQETSVRKRKIKKSSRVQPEFYHSVQVTPTRKPSSGTASYRCSMSSSADLSEEEDLSQKSGTGSPAPGDTLPWNLPKHERSKRKIHGGSVLDPAERAVLRIADERDKVQKKTFTKWINQHLMKVRKHVNDLYEDLRDGHNLISLLEVLSGDTLPREKGRMRFHRLQNVQIALDYLKKRQVKLVNIRNDDITDGNPKLTLGLIWTIILHFQISDIHVTGESEDMSAKERLLLWSQQTTEGYAGIRCENFTTCWRDGRLFNAIIHKYRPDLIDMNTVAVQSNLANLEHAFFVAEKLGVARLLDPEDVDVSSPDEKSVITYVSSLYDAFPKVPEGGEGISANDVEVKWVEYQNMVNYLMQWIRHHVTIMSDRTFPNNPVELKALYNQYLQFKETEIPPKETDKLKIKRLYKLLEVWIEFGRIKLPQGYHPNDIEKEWGKLIIAMLEREKTLRPEVERLEMLQQIANRIQRDSRSCEDKLILARNALQADTKRLESGLQFQHEAEIAGYLLESENLLRQQVIDAQILIDGKYYQADQLVQRVAKLRDELMAIRTECSSLYSKGHALTTEQTKLMISGITESLNSGFTTNLTPELNAAMTQGLTPSLTSSSLTSGLSSGLTSRLTPAMTPAYTPGIPPRLIQSYVTGVDGGTLQTLKLMQIRKPLMKSAFVDQNLTEEEVNMKFVQDLLNWVEEMQVQLDRVEWGSDLPSVESHLENHKNVHKAIEEFESSLKEAKISEIQMTAPLKLSYAEKLHKLESQYSKLLNTSRNQERHLDTLHDFVSRATRELIWLNEKEEEEVAYDWSERNPNITRKKEYHAELMRELDQKEEVIKSVQEIAEQLLLENHPARLTIEAYRAAMQTQWSWILQLCHCVEQHLRENAAYFEFFSDAKEAMEYLKNLKDAIYRKYSCDRSSSLHRLEDLVQESMEEKEQLLQYKSTVAGLVGRAKAIIQLKPRNPDCILKTSIPIKAICDYRQIEITIYKDDECILANNSHRAKWKVISPSGNEAMVPSVCFTVPPPNKEAIDTANRIEQQFQNVLALWHESHVNMKSVVSWHYLTNEIEAVRAGNVASIKTMLPGEHQQVLSNLQSRFDDFVEDSQESKIFTSSDTAQLEREVSICKQYYQELLKSAEREEHEESIYNLYISEVRNIRLRLETCEERLIRQIRTPMERDDLHESVFRISEQEKLKKELDRLKDDLGVITDKCEEFFSQAAGSPSVPTLRSELSVVIQNMNQVYSMSSIYIDKLKTVNLVLKNTQGAESLVKLYETKLCEEEAVTADKTNIENLMGTLKQWRSEVDEKREVFHALEDELQKAKMISDQMFKMHKERDLDFDWHKEKVDQLAERWQNIHSQIENRLRDLEGINKSLKYYKDTYNSLDTWIQQVEDTQRKIQEIRPENSKALAKQLNQHKMLVSEIEMKQSKIDECQKYAEQYSAAVKDYELQTMTYRAMVDSQQKSPVKRRRMQSSSDFIIQEFMDLRTRYTALVTLMTQYIKFAGDSLKRLEEEERSMEEEKKEHVEKAGDLLKWVSNLSKTLSKEGGEKAEKTDLPKQQISLEEMSAKKEQIAEALQTTQAFLAKHSDKMTDEERGEMEKQVKSLQEGYSLLASEALKQLQEAHYLDDEKMDEKDVAERQQECKEKLQEICDMLTQTENRLIGQQESLVIGDSKAELEQYQTKQEEIQKDMRTSAQTLAEIVKNTENFLKENGGKLSQEDKAVLEQKLNEAKTKCLLLSQKAEESKKELDKAMTTAIKQETEKVAAIEQLEESKNTIENLLDWLSNVDKEAEHGRKFKQAIEQNGTHFEEGDVKALEGEEDDVNGNLLEIQQDIETQVDGLVKSTEDNLNQQYQKVKAQHEKIISQQQAVIIATQSAQALLEKQGHYLSPEEKEKMQRNMKELKAQYETALAESERKMKMTHSLREELEKFDRDYSEFETWLQQAEQELDNLEAGASDFSGIMVKLKRQKSFSEDVISHKGDLRYITISGQRVLDAARSCSKRDGVKVDKDGIDTSATYAEVQNKLDSASDRFKSLYTKCSILGNNLKDLADKYQHYEDASSGLLSGLQASEVAVNKQLSEPVAVDPKNLQRQLEETKVLQGQVSNHQIAVEKLKKAAEVLLDSRGELASDKEEIQKTLDDIVERYDNLSKSVNERNEKLQITLTRSLSVQDGLDEMLDWMEGVEKSLEEQDQVPLNSAAIQDIISKSIMLEQDIAGRQSSINTMNDKVKKFMETADPSTASSLQAKMSELAGRFSAASKKHKEKLMKMEELKTKVELFEDLSEKLQSFLDEKNQALSETEAPRKDVSEVSQYMQEASIELAKHKKDLETLQNLLEELSLHALPGDKALVLEKVNALSKKFREVEETVKEKEEDVSSCQKEIDTFELLVESLKKWIKETTERIPAAQPSLNTEELKKPLEDTLNLKDEWTLKATELQKMNSRGTLLCNLISAVTSPAKLRAVAKSGGTVLNGEGGAPGTQDFLKNKELTSVQQAMSDVNHSYEDLGVSLKKKISELESMLSKMQNIQEESTSVMQWLQKMDKTASDWEAAPTDSEAVKAQVEQHKLFETELKQSENKVQELKDKVTELLEKNPNSPEAPKWRQVLDKIDSKWKELNQVTSERQQKLEESSNYLTQFQTAEAQLKHWLVEKELMVSVLGPLSIDPNMLNTQKQQVQILLKEFDTRKPQYEQLTMAGEGILKRPGEHPPSHEIVKEQLAAVAQKWDNLTGQLSNRCDRIDQAIVKSTEYQSLLRSLSDKLSALDSKLSSSLAVSTQPDAVKQQLEIAKEMKKEIEQEMRSINAAQVLCEELSTLVGEDYLKAELTRQLDGILKSFKDIEQKSDNHVQQLQSAYTTSHQFQQTSKDFQAWLDGKKEELKQARPISAKLETLQSLIEEQKDFMKTLTNEISSYEKIVAEGESILQKTQGADKAALQSQIATLRSNWDEMDKQVKERQGKLTDCLEKALTYKQHVENLQPWIEKCQSNLSELKVSINPAEIENSVVQVRAWQKDLDKHHGIVELLNNTAESLLSASQTDKEIVKEETKVLNEKVSMVTEQLHKKRECLENMAQRLKEFQESSRETEKQLQSAKEHLEAHDSLGPQSFSNKHLTMMQAQQKALQALKPHVDLVRKLAQDLVVEASDSTGVSDLLLQAESLEQEYSAVNQQVEDRCSFLETKLQGIGHFQNSIREMFSQFAEFDDELDSMAPVGRDLDVLQSQREDIKHFLKKLEDLIMNNENANKNCKMMLATEAEASPDLVGIKRDLEALNKQCNKLLDRAKAREDQVEGTINRVEEFYSKLKEFSSLLGRAEEHEESQGPVGMETETINQQLNTFKVFQKEEIEPLQVKQQEVNWLGQGLIQSAAKSTNTESLEHDLEDVNTRWKTLNKKVAQRAAQLQEALLHCGRFQDALESLLSWLIDTEELVANQKPPSAEFKVVKAQIQEQKLLQRLLDDRKPTVEVIKREGEKIAESAEPADKVKILKQLSLLDSRWDALLSKAETRNRQLEGISVVAQQFHEALEPLVEWLSATEKRLANAEPIGTQASKLQQQISQHKALEDDVLAHNKSLLQAISTGQSLKTMSSREDKDMVQEKLDSSQARYIEIQEKSNSRSELLQQAYCNAQIFGEDEVELMNWLNEVHDKLSKLSVQDCNTELLEKQHSELLELQEEILLRKQNVDLAIQNGLELLKQTTGDEVIIIQDKLEGIKVRYKDITKLSSDVSKTLEQALQLAGQLHSTHEELCKWLDKVEVELLSYETQIPQGEELSQAQERQKELKKEAKNNKALLDTLNEVGSAFLELVPWRAREGLDKMITEDNERYRLVSDTISQKVDEIDAAILRSQQFDQAADAELAWIAETEKKLMSLGDIRLEQDQTTAQLQVQKAFTMEILRHKDTIDELVKSGDKIMNTCTEEEKQAIKKKLKSLLQKYDTVCQMNSERNLQLERAQSLVNQFWETYEELWPWLTETEMIISQLPAPALEYETLKQQQEEHRQLRELIAEHKPHIDKMNKTGPQLLELSPGEGFSIQEKYVAADTLYSKIKEDVKKRALALDEAISQCTQFHDKIDPTLESLQRIVERLRQPPSISAEVEKIKEQISENKNVSMDLEKLQPVYETLKQRGEEMIARSEGADKDVSAKAVQDKLDQMVLIWQDIQTLTEEREAKLLDVMELAEKFWCDHMALVATIKDTQDFIRELEGPGVDPSVVKQQQEAAEAAKEEIDGLQEELETVVSLGSELRAACGEPDKPIVNKSIDELNSAWDALNKTWKERVDKLAEAMQAAVQYQDGLQAIFDWVDIAGIKLASMSPVGTDLETVKQQTEELKQFKTEAYQQQIEMERLNHQAELLLKKVTQESDKHTVQDPLSELRLMWDSLEEKIINRQHKLEGALLALGQFQHALDELLTWLTHTEDLLNEQKPVGGDPKAIEIELAKHHVLQNDVLAHQSTVEAVKKAGSDLIESSAVEEASNLRSKLELLNQRWQNVLEKTEQRKQQLDSALIQAQGFHGEVEDMQQWLTDTERQLLASKPVGGLPETAREQLNTHMELCAAFEAKEETYKCLMQKGQQMLARCPESAETNVEQDINNLKEKWESVQTKLGERKTKLEEALNLAMEFHNSLQDFINWLTQAEQTLTAASRPSLILDTVLFQIDEHKVFATEVNSHRDQIIELDKTGTHLKYFSQKQDVVLIKNLLISVQSRWEKVVQRLVERGRALDDARKRAKQFHEAWHKLMEWLEESEKSLDSDLEIANDPDKIKMQLAQHKEFQKSLGAKHSVYDTTNRTGRSLKEKTTLADDNLKLDDMLSELRDKWDTICGKSVERQNKLEEALLFSGQFTDALQALIDWLYKIEPQLAEDQPVHGDIDLVMNLIDNHKVFQKELGKRTSSVQALKRSARELIEGSRDDSSWVKVQMQELSTRWETVCALSVSKQTRLEQALRQAEEFHSVVHVLLEWLAEAEQALRFHGVLPDDEEALRTLIDQHREFMKKLEEKKGELNKATGMGEAILAICHPDSITTIKHWITIIRARFEEVLAWAKQHQQRLAGALAGLIANQELLEALLSWLQWAETTLTEKDKEVIPQEIEEVKALIAEHQTFMEEMTRKQPDVDKVTKTYKRKALEPTPVQSHIPVLDKGRAGRKRSPTPGLYPSAAQAQIETKNPRVNLLVSKWQQVWLLALERRRKLNDALDRLEELREFANFDFDIWRKKYMRWMNHKKSRVMDFFRRIDKDQDGKITRQEFIDGILSSKFPTSRLEMSAVADIFDRDGDGYIDYYEFVAALHPNKDAYKPLTDADKIEDEVTRQVAKCKCAKRFQVEQIGDNKYRFFLGNQFGDSQQLRLVRILRSTVMVRVGGGWMALDEFLVKNDPCRAKGRTNVELREKFILADGASQSMAAFRPRGRRSRPSSRGASPNRSTSLSSQAAAPPQAVATSTPKTPHHLTRNYGKPWLANSKTSTPSKPAESSDYQGSSGEGTPIQGSKLRLPGYLSGKGFHSGEDSGILSTAATRVRAQFAETRRTPSRPGSRAGSKAGSRSSSRRGSDASDFDISEIQSVCSDMSETVPATSRPTPRAGSRPGSAKPSKIPTPQRRPIASKLDRSLKR
ncbi:LOW QUALITY PROTEIN: dystonin [Phasianus colchicus]|uniref:LOW QUALITY PROTEIN: dystonin n=1 Tax=Phasianus colchicus TaxID=9054 RepID=UPI00129E4153|nr:LOW QUALITY PROTEIN: dystonin [Phasianus colchicus]